MDIASHGRLYHVPAQAASSPYAAHSAQSHIQIFQITSTLSMPRTTANRLATTCYPCMGVSIKTSSHKKCVSNTIEPPIPVHIGKLSSPILPPYRSCDHDMLPHPNMQQCNPCAKVPQSAGGRYISYYLSAPLMLSSWQYKPQSWAISQKHQGQLCSGSLSRLLSTIGTASWLEASALMM